MFIERATVKRYLLAPAERNVSRAPRTIAGNIALLWSARVIELIVIYKHLAPLERNELHRCTSKLNLRMTNEK
jgi:hypothetical protein